MTETKLHSAPVISVTAAIHRSRLWDIQRDIDKLGDLMADDIDRIAKAHDAVTVAVLEMCAITDKYAKIAAEQEMGK